MRCGSSRGLVYLASPDDAGYLPFAFDAGSPTVKR